MDMRHYKTFIQIGLNILHYRKERGITQLQLAELVNTSRTHIQRVETASAAPSVDLLLDIASALGIPPRALFDFKPEQ